MGCYVCRNAVYVALLAAGLAALAYLPPLEPAVMVGGPERVNLQTDATKPLDEPDYTRSTVEFPCVDAMCEAWLYVPKGLTQPPVMLMAHGMGGQKVGLNTSSVAETCCNWYACIWLPRVEKRGPPAALWVCSCCCAGLLFMITESVLMRSSMQQHLSCTHAAAVKLATDAICTLLATSTRPAASVTAVPLQQLLAIVLLLQDFGLHNYASKFASNGMAVFVFDYRGWGGSSGEPRHWLSAKRHMADWRAAIQHVRSNLTDVVDVSKLSLWGSSFAGGHVLVVASEPEFAPHISAVVAQVGVALSGSAHPGLTVQESSK